MDGFANIIGWSFIVTLRIIWVCSWILHVAAGFPTCHSLIWFSYEKTGFNTLSFSLVPCALVERIAISSCLEVNLSHYSVLKSTFLKLSSMVPGSCLGLVSMVYQSSCIYLYKGINISFCASVGLETSRWCQFLWRYSKCFAMLWICRIIALTCYGFPVYSIGTSSEMTPEWMS